MHIDDIKTKEEYLDLMPRPCETDMENMEESIKTRGIQVPLIINQNKILIDGYTRITIAKRLSIKDVPVKVKDFRDVDEEKLFILSANCHRRHLTGKQRVILAAKYKKILEKIKQKRSKQNLKQFNRAGKNTGSVEKGDSRDIAGKKFGVSGRSVDMAEQIVDNLDNPEIKKMWDGDVSLSACYRKLGNKPEPSKKEYHTLECSQCKEQTEIRCPLTNKPLKLVIAQMGKGITYRIVADRAEPHG